MADNTRDEFIDAGTAETEQYEPTDEVKQEFSDAQRLASGAGELIKELVQHHSHSPVLSGGDVDADWAGDSGEETVGGSAPTPDQDEVDQLGEAAGLTYEDDEPLRSGEKVEERDRKRWELDPASSDDYNDRVNHEGE